MRLRIVLLLLISASGLAPSLLAQSCPTRGLAGGTSWFVNTEPIQFRSRTYVKYGLPRILAPTDVVRRGDFRGVGVYAEPSASNPPEVIYIPVRAECEFQPYQIEVAPDNDRGSSSGNARPARAVRLALGRTVSGTLTDNDPALEDDSHYDLYTFQGRAGQRVRITMTSDDFDAYLHVGRLYGTTFESMETDDDSGGGTNAQITLTLPETGTYAIRANALADDGRGAYRIRVERMR